MDTAAKLKQSISNITEEDKANFWEKDLGVSLNKEEKSSSMDEPTTSFNNADVDESRVESAHDNTKNNERKTEQNSSKVIDFNDFTLSSNEVMDENQHLLVDSVGNPDDYETQHDLSSGNNNQNVITGEEVPTTCKEFTQETTSKQQEQQQQKTTSLDQDSNDFDKLIHTLDEQNQRDVDNLETRDTTSDKSKVDQVDEDTKSMKGEEPGSEIMAPFLESTSNVESTNTTKQTVSMCPPPQSDFTNSTGFKPSLGYTPALTSSWTGSFDGKGMNY